MSHNTHCCKKHGCKYGDNECSVVYGDDPGIVCEICDWEQHDPETIRINELEKQNTEMRELLEQIAACNSSDGQKIALEYLHQYTLNVLRESHNG